MDKKIKYTSYKDMLSHLDSLDSDTLKVHTLMQYFLDNVEYDYATLELAKLPLDTILALDEQYDASSPSDRAIVISTLMHTHSLSKEAVDRILKNYGKEINVPAIPERVIMGKVQKAKPAYTTHCGLLSAYNQTGSPVKYKDGLIQKGVCADYSIFINQTLKDLHLDSHIVEGYTPICHVWNKVGNLNYDITYAIFMRDHYDGWHTRATHCDFLGVSDDALQKIHPSRVTSSIDGKALQKPYTLDKE